MNQKPTFKRSKPSRSELGGSIFAAILLSFVHASSAIYLSFKDVAELLQAAVPKIVQDVCEIAHDAPLWDVFDSKLAGTGYTHESYEVRTEDQYILTLVRLVKIGEPLADRANRTPVIFQHGFTMTSENWLTVHSEERSIVLQAMDAGFDVWLNNSRGTRFSQKHETLNAARDKAYWDFSFDTQGAYDTPANILKVLEVTGYQKTALVSFSLGTMQTFYAMAKDEVEFFENHVSVFVALAPCTKMTHSSFAFMDLGAAMYDRIFADFANTGVKALYGPNWSRDKMTLCANENLLVCYAIADVCIGAGQAVPVRIIEHALQSQMKDQFVEFDPKMRHRSQLRLSKLHTPAVQLSNIKNVPIHMFVGKEDLVCSAKDAIWTSSQLTGLARDQFSFSLYMKRHDHFVDSTDLSYFQNVIEVLQRPSNKPVRTAN